MATADTDVLGTNHIAVTVSWGARFPAPSQTTVDASNQISVLGGTDKIRKSTLFVWLVS